MEDFQAHPEPAEASTISFVAAIRPLALEAVKEAFSLRFVGCDELNVEQEERGNGETLVTVALNVHCQTRTFRSHRW